MTSPLIQDLIDNHGYPLLNADNLDDFTKNNGTVVLFFTEEPKRYPESLDVAVILPELVRAFPDKFRAAVVDRSLESELKDKYDIAVWPCLVFLRDGRFLGKISKVRDWHEYMERIPEILDGPTKHNPGVGIPVVNEKVEQTNA